MDINATLYWAPVVPNGAVQVQVFAIPVSVGVGVVVFLFFWPHGILNQQYSGNWPDVGLF